MSPALAAEYARLLGESEPFFVKPALQELLDRSNIHLRVKVRAA